jgi:hypothetical protein
VKRAPLAVLVTAFPALLIANSASAQTASSDLAQLRAELDAANARLAAAKAETADAEARIARIEQRLAAAGSSEQPAAAEQTDPAAVTERKQLPLGHIRVEGQDGDGAGQKNGAMPAGLAEQSGGPMIGGVRIAPENRSVAFELLAGSGSGRASFALNTSQTHDLGIVAGTTDTSLTNTEQWGLTLSAPLSKSGDQTSFATLDGLASGTKLEFSWSSFSMPVPGTDFEKSNKLLQRAHAACLAAPEPYAPGCDVYNDAFLQKFMPEKKDRDAVDRAYAAASIGKASGWTLHSAIGYDKYTWYDDATLAKAKQSRVSFSAGGAFTFFPVVRSSLTFDASYDHSFKAEDTEVACLIPSTPGLVKCVSGALAAPGKEDKLIGSAQFRTILPVSDEGLIKRIGLAPRFEYDALSNEIAADLPVYLIPDDKGKLTGGFHLGYTTKDKVVFGIFFGAAFDPTKN